MTIKIAVILPTSIINNLKLYNVQEVGLAQELSNYGISSDIYMAGDVKKYIIEEICNENNCKVNIIWMPCLALPGKQGIFPTLFKLLNQQRYHLIQIFDRDQITSFLVALYGKKKGIPIVLYQGMYRDYSGMIKRLLQILFNLFTNRFFIRNVKIALCKTKEAENYLKNKGFKNTTVCPVGLDTHSFRKEEQINWRKRLNIKRNIKIILYIGTIEPRRNIDFLLKLFSEIIKENKGLSLIIIGRGKEKERCEKLIENLNLGEKVKLIDMVYQNQLPSIYNIAYLFILPSHYEIFGMVILEAMYHGVPVIALEAAGPNEIIAHKKDGIILPDLCLSEWKTNINRILLDKKIHSRMAKNAKQKIRSSFLWAQRAKHIAGIYKNLIKKGNI